MNETIVVQNSEMQIREYNGQRVVTFKDIDTVHHRPSGTARKSFNRNKKDLFKAKITSSKIRTKQKHCMV